MLGHEFISGVTISKVTLKPALYHSVPIRNAVGAVVGIAVLIAILGAHRSGSPLTAFHRAWLMMAATGVASATIATALGRVRARHVELAEEIGEAEIELLGEPL